MNGIPKTWIDVRVVAKITGFPWIKIRFLLPGSATSEAWILEKDLKRYVVLATGWR